MRMWDWERKWPMRRGMLGRRARGIKGTTGSASSSETHPCSLTHTHMHAQISEHVLFSPQSSKVGRRKCPPNYSRPRETWPPQGPSTHPLSLYCITLVCWLHHCLHSAGCVDSRSHASATPAEWMDGVLFVVSVSVLPSHRRSALLWNFHRQTEAEGLEVIAVCITAILPLSRAAAICMQVQCALSYVVFNGIEMVLLTKLLKR